MPRSVPPQTTSGSDRPRGPDGRFLPKQPKKQTKKAQTTAKRRSSSPSASPRARSVSPSPSPSPSGSRSPSLEDYTPHTLAKHFTLEKGWSKQGLTETRVSNGPAPSTYQTERKTRSEIKDRTGTANKKKRSTTSKTGNGRKVMLKAESKTGGKFWEAWADGSTVHVRFGSVKALSDDGTEGGITRSSEYNSVDEAQAQLQKRIKEKLGKGYSRT